MFDLEKSIAEWRRQMLAAGIETPVPLAELESHLREEIERQMQSGRSSRQAFETAIQQIGPADPLKGEFAKVGDSKRPLLLLLLGLGFGGCWIEFDRSPALALVYCVLLTGLIAASFIDFEQFLIPDQITISGILVGFLCSALLPQLQGQKFVTAGVVQSLLGIGTGAALIYFILRTGKWLFGKQRIALAAGTRIVFTETALQLPEKTLPYQELFYRKSDAIELQAQSLRLGHRSYQDVPIRLTSGRLQVGDETFDPEVVPRMEIVGSELVLPREAMGFGDVKFMAAIGAFLGWQAVIFSLIVSSLIGSLVGVGLIAAHRREWSVRLPYAPCIALAAIIWIFGGSYFVDVMFK